MPHHRVKPYRNEYTLKPLARERVEQIVIVVAVEYIAVAVYTAVAVAVREDIVYTAVVNYTGAVVEQAADCSWHQQARDSIRG